MIYIEPGEWWKDTWTDTKGYSHYFISSDRARERMYALMFIRDIFFT
jgi:hypothetical protein